ncbi:MAG: DUF2723 domain-containing protein [Candidatus Firestonebacteria bacterium]|nr:DUF2723 domain-containing protein [Candidatus Firestonebacteria bacterium]
MNKKLEDNLIYILPFFIFLLYIKTLPSTLYSGDPGELITGAYTLGIVHPPGYPLYVLLGKIFTIVFPIGNIAFRVNLMTMILAVFGLVIFYFTVLKYFNSKTSAVLSVILLAFSPTFWAQSSIGEVYTLNFLFFSILLYLELNMPDSILIYYIYGLAISNHHTMILLAPLFILKIWKENRIKDLSIYPAFFLGLSPYIYILIRSIEIPLFNWGNPSNLSNFINHITRREYGTIFKNPFSIINSFNQVWNYILSLSAQFSPVIVIIGILSIIFIINNKRLALLLSFILSGVFVILLLNIPLKPRELFDIEVFYIPSYALFSLFAGGSITWIEKYNKVNYKKYIIIFVVLAVSSFQIFYNFQSQNRSYNNFTYNYGLNILNTIRKDGLVFAEKDSIASSLSFLMLVENRRKDVIFYNPALQIIRNLYPSTKDENEKYIKNKIEWNKIPVYRPNIAKNLFKQGLLYTNKLTDINYYIYYNLYKVFNVLPDIADFECRNIITEELLSEMEFLYMTGRTKEALELMNFISKIGYDMHNLHIKLGITYEMHEKYYKALDEYLLALNIYPENAEIHNNIGFVYYELGNYLLAYNYHETAIKLDPNLSNAYYGFALTQESMGKIKESKENWKKFLELEKENTVWRLEAERHIGHINKGVIK